MTAPVEFFGSIESGYRNVPTGRERPSGSIFVDLPNTYYDPIEGQRALEDQLELLASLDRLGLDGTLHTEQHNGPAGLLPNSMLGAAWLAARTERIKIGVVGPLLNAYQSPIRLAEEIAIVDTLSKGRLVVGLPVGIGMQYHALGMNPATARARHAEAHDLLAKALREPGPFQWRGQFFNHEYVNVWPRPGREIEFMMPGGGSLETLELAAKRRYTYQSQLNDRPMMIKVLERFRDLCREQGYEPEPRQSAVVVDLHVAETDAIARQETEAIYLWTYQNYLVSPERDLLPPGYTSLNSMRQMRSRQYVASVDETTYDDLLANKWLIAGSPETVVAGLQELIADTGVGRIILGISIGLKPRWMIEKSMGLFAEQVLPHFRPDGRPLSENEPRHGYRTRLEYAARRRTENVPVPTAVHDGFLVDVDKHRYDPASARIKPWPTESSQ